MRASVLEAVTRHDRLWLTLSLLAVVLLSWAYLFTGAGTMQEMDGMLMPMRSGPWTWTQALLMLLMWVIMMMAMMLPSAAPMILLFASIARRRQSQRKSTTSSSLFVLGYVIVWGGFSVLAVALQYALEHYALLSPMMQTTSTTLAGLVLIGAGLYQFTPFKQTCLQHCRSPLDFVLAHWRNGAAGALNMGIRHGLYCLGCCWMLMLLLFVGGVMNMLWIAGLAIFVLIEKLSPAGHWLGRGAGVLLMAWGLATLFMLV